MRNLMWIGHAIALASMAVPCIGRASGQEVTFTKVLDSETQIPGGGGTLGPFDALADDGTPMAMDANGNLAFAAGGRIFAIIDGELHLVPRPEGDLRHLAIDGFHVAFGVLDLGGSRVGGIFRWEPGSTPIEVAGAQTLVPGGDSCVFWTREDGVSDWRFSLDGDAVLFFGRGSDDSGSSCSRLRGTFLWRSGSIEHLAEVSVASENSPGRASIDAGLIAFLNGDGGIYAQELGGAPARIVGPGDRVPGRSVAFDALGPVLVAAERVAFRARDTAGRWGAYLWEAGTLSVLAEEGAELPGGRSLGYMQDLRLGRDRFAVVGSSSQGQLLYLKALAHGWDEVIDESCCAGVSEFAGDQLLLPGARVVRPDGSLLKVLQRGDVLDGQQVAAVFPGDLGGNELALVIRFEGSHVDHLYVAQLPPIAVDIDVIPHRAVNRVHPRSRRSIPIAILGSETFEVEDVDLTTVGLGPDAAPIVRRVKLRDVNRDGIDDLVVRLRPREARIVAGDTEVCLSGETFDGLEFEGCDALRTGRARTTVSR